MGKDVIVALCRLFNCDEVFNAAFGIMHQTHREYYGMEWGALAGVLPVYDAHLNWYEWVERLQLKTFSSSPETTPLPPTTHPPEDQRTKTESALRKQSYIRSSTEYPSHLVFDLSTLVQNSVSLKILCTQRLVRVTPSHQHISNSVGISRKGIH